MLVTKAGNKLLLPQSRDVLRPRPRMKSELWRLTAYHAANRGDRIQAVHLRHLQVHEREVRPMGAELLNRFAAIRRFANQRQIRFGTDQDGDALSHQNMIVD